MTIELTQLLATQQIPHLEEARFGLSCNELSRILTEQLPVNVIGFYERLGAFGSFSNFAHTPVHIDGITWPTSEHYYQAQKYEGVNPDAVAKILGSDNPMEAAEVGRDHSLARRSNWSEIKNDIMRIAVLEKTQQHPEVRAELLSTDSSYLVERSKGDSYWGCGRDGKGRNMLGAILMEIRELWKRGNGSEGEQSRAAYLQNARARIAASSIKLSA